MGKKNAMQWMSLIAMTILLTAWPALSQDARDEVLRPSIPGLNMKPAPPEVTGSEPATQASPEKTILSVQPEGAAALGANGLSIVGNVSYQISGSSVQLTADRVENTSSTRTSGTLRLALWMSEGGYRATGYRTATYQFSTVLLPQQYFYDISHVVPFTTPPTGCYFVSMQLEEYQSSGSFAYVDYVDFTGNKLSVNGGCPTIPPRCSFTLSSGSALIGAAGGNGSVSVIGSPSGCTGSYSASSNSPWILITSGASGSGSGARTLTYSVDANPSSSPRSGSMTIPGATFTVSQSGIDTPRCDYSISPQSRSIGSSGGSGSVTVSGAPAGCSGNWTAWSNSSWLTITSGASGSGAGPFALTYVGQPNGSSQSRTGTLSVAGQAFTVIQAPTGYPSCNQDATTLCLAENRYAVSATWQTSDRSGTGQAVRLTSDTGYFWFFDSSNVEIVIKVLNGCGVNSRYWVFSGGLTNVRVVLTVNDTKTGTVWTTTNPLNTAFKPIQDTNAFATCP